MAVNLASLIIEMWLLAILMLALHYQSPRFGLAPLIFIIGALVGILRFASSIAVYISLSDSLNFTVAGNVIIPIVISAVFIIYVANGTLPARVAILSIIGVELLTIIIVTSLGRHLDLPNGGSFARITPDSPIFNIKARDVFASSMAFLIDMYAVGIVFQASANRFKHIPTWIRICATLLIVFLLNTIIFWTLAAQSISELMDFLPGGLIGSALSAVLIAPPIAYYLISIAPRLPNFVGVENRSTFDLLFGSYGTVEYELIESQEALAERTAQLTGLTVNITQGFWLYDPEAKSVTHVSPAYEQIWGIPLDVALKEPKRFLDIIHPDDRERIRKLLPTQKEGQYDEQFRIVKADGSICWVRDRAFVIRNENGIVSRIAGITEDITARRKVEHDIKFLTEFRTLITRLSTQFINLSAEEMESAILNALAEIGEFVDADRSFIGWVSDDKTHYVNILEWVRIGIEPPSTPNRELPISKYPWMWERFSQLETVQIPRLADLPPEAGSYKHSLQRGNIQSAVAIPLIDGAEAVGFLGFYAVRTPKVWSEDVINLLYLVGQIFTNAYERKKAEQTMLHNQKLQLELEKEKELSEFRVNFISLVSHQFRTPLSVIHTAASILEHHIDQLNPEQRHGHFERISGQVDQLSHMLDEVLLTMRAEAGHLKFSPTLLDLDTYCLDIVEKLRMTLSDTQTLTFTISDDLQLFNGDTNLLDHVLTNLLSNAIKYSPDGGDITLDVRQEDDQIIIQISDEGIGISEEDQKHLFTPYFRAKNVGKIRGTGLGLKIAKECTELHGGNIEIESQLHEGTTFCVILPL